ncbi:MAG: RsmB/NOP family class I SAM-dependent RNA methyltransferase [Candidatus Altiarchaeota archaeon]
MNLPAGLEEDLRILLRDEYQEFLECAYRPARQSFRINTLKAELDFPFEFSGERIPWCPAGHYSASQVSDSVEHFQGLVYVQEAASMLPAEALDPQEGDTVLDLSAAPGSKSTHMAALMGNGGCIVANDVDYARLKSLRFNLNRMGVINTILSWDDGASLEPDILFDKVLLDAPCSNAGQLRDNPEALTTWSRKKVKQSSELQKRLIIRAADLLKEGGTLVYSTCTFSPEENEEVVDHAMEERGLRVEPIRGKFGRHPGVKYWRGREYAREVVDTARLYPHDNDTGGFYVAKLRK